MKAPPDSGIRVELVVVYVSNEGAQDYEMRFVDADGKAGTVLTVEPDGTMTVTDPEPE